MPTRVQSLSAAAFAPFGTVLPRPPGPPNGTGPGWTWWAEQLPLPPDDRPWTVGVLHLTPVPRPIDWAERHARSAELIVPLTGPCRVYVAPDGPPGQPDVNRLQLFEVPPGEAALLRPGVWHGAPLAADRESVTLVLLPAGVGTSDTVKVTFPPLL